MTDKKISELTSTGTANSTALIPVAISGSNLAYTAQAIANLAPGATTPQSLSKVDDTNVTLTLGGNPTSALMSSVTLTLGWTGTLSSTRQAATTVNSVNNDSNITGTITAQALALGFSGVLAAGRGGTSVASFQAAGMTATRVYTFPDAAANVAALNIEDQVVSGGGYVVAKSLSTGTVTIDAGARPLQYITNNGAFTINAPASDSACLLLITNSTSASTITFSNFSVPSSTGDALTTTSTHKFTVHVWRINGTAGYRIAAHQ